MNVFEAAIERGDIDLGEYAQPYTSERYLTAWIALPENDDMTYRALRNLLYTGDGLSNERGRRNNRKIINLISSGDGELLERFRRVNGRYPATSMMGQLHYLVDQVRATYVMITMLRNAPPLPPKTPEEIEQEQFWDRFKRPRRDRNDYDDTDDLNAPWGFIPGRPAA